MRTSAIRGYKSHTGVLARASGEHAVDVCSRSLSTLRPIATRPRVQMPVAGPLMMRFSALPALQFTLRSVRARCGRGARFALFLSASALAHAAPDAQVPLDRPGAAAVAGGRPPRARAGAGTGGIRLTDSRPKVWMHSSGDASAAKSVTTCASTCAMRHVTRTVRRPKAASSRGGKGAERLSLVWCAHWPRIRRVACRGHGRLSVPGVQRVGRIATP